MTDSAQSEWTPSPEFWRRRPVAVTGASGFAGSHLVAQLVDLGADVVVLLRDELPPAWPARSDAVAVVRGDLADQAAVGRLLADHGVVTAFHLAAQNRPWTAEWAPVPSFETNIRGTWLFLEAARLAPSVGQVVVASTDEAYGEQLTTPCTEDMPPLAVRPLEVSRACADLVAGSFARTFGLQAAIARCPTLFGPGDTDWARLVPGVIRSLVEGQPPVVHAEARLSRDYLFVVDAARSYLQLAEALAERTELAGEVFNFSAERPVTVLELVEMLQIGAATRLEPEFQVAGPPEAVMRHLSAGKAREVLGWRPWHTFEEAVLLTVQWYQDHLAGGGPPTG